MSFDDLPDNWLDLPLTEPRLVADVLDLCVFHKDRERGALVLLLCDDDARLVQPVVISEPEALTGRDRSRPFEVVREAMGDGGSLLVAIARRRGLTVTEDDLAWADAAARVCGDDMRLLGVHVVTVRGSRRVDRPVRAA